MSQLLITKRKVGQAVVAHAFTSSAWRQTLAVSQFKARLVYRVTSRKARDTQRNTDSINKPKQNQGKLSLAAGWGTSPECFNILELVNCSPKAEMVGRSGRKSCAPGWLIIYFLICKLPTIWKSLHKATAFIKSSEVSTVVSASARPLTPSRTADPRKSRCC